MTTSTPNDQRPTPAGYLRASGVARWELIVVIGFVLIAGGCSGTPGGPPPIEIDRTACSHCGMLISEPLYAAAYRAPGVQARVFDDIGCLRKAARTESGPLTTWFHDAGDESWFDGESAVFVASPEIRSPMGGGLIAYRDPAAARRAAQARHGRVLHSVDDMLADADVQSAKGEM